jgi:hypothetical protein
MTAYNFPTYFAKAPQYCPLCGHKLGATNAIDGFDLGNICNCSSCQFEYAKAQEQDAPDPGYPICKEHGDYFYASSDYSGCAVCDLKASWAEVDKLGKEILDQQSKMQALNAIIETDSEMTSTEAQAIENAAKFISAAVIRMIRDEARQAVIEACTLPVGDLIRIHASAEQMDADGVEIGTVGELADERKTWTAEELANSRKAHPLSYEGDK